MSNYLNTVEFGRIRIVKASDIMHPYDTFIDFDLIYEWAFYSLASGEIVAVWIADEE